MHRPGVMHRASVARSAVAERLRILREVAEELGPEPLAPPERRDGGTMMMALGGRAVVVLGEGDTGEDERRGGRSREGSYIFQNQIPISLGG
jgi:hypothetical protein